MKLPSIANKRIIQLSPIRVSKEERDMFYRARMILKKSISTIIREAVLDYYLPLMYEDLKMNGKKSGQENK